MLGWLFLGFQSTGFLIGCLLISGRRTSTIVAVRQYRDRDSASSTAKRAGNEADQQSTELLDKANAYVDDLKVLQPSNSLYRVISIVLMHHPHAFYGFPVVAASAVDMHHHASHYLVHVFMLSVNAG